MIDMHALLGGGGVCGCHDPGVFGHKPPCPWAPPKPSLILVDKATGQGSVLIRTGARYDISDHG